MRTQFISLSAVLIILLTSCSEDNVPPTPLDCPTYPAGWMFSITDVQRRNADFYLPTFNPNNQFEFAYAKYDYTSQTFEIRKRNLITNFDQLIVNAGGYVTFIKWSKSDWILYNPDVPKLWRVKSDGTYNSEVISSFYGNNLSFNSDGSEFIYNSNGNTIIADINGANVDTLNIEESLYSWSTDDKILFRQQNGSNLRMAYYKISDQTTTSLDLTSGMNWYHEWMPDGISFVTNYANSLYLINSQTWEMKLIMSNCGDRYRFYKFTVSPNGSCVLAERSEWNMINSTSFEAKDDIVLISVDGKNEKVVDLYQ
jgi:hypothetical protein